EWSVPPMRLTLRLRPGEVTGDSVELIVRQVDAGLRWHAPDAIAHDLFDVSGVKIKTLIQQRVIRAKTAAQHDGPRPHLKMTNPAMRIEQFRAGCPRDGARRIGGCRSRGRGQPKAS